MPQGVTAELVSTNPLWICDDKKVCMKGNYERKYQMLCVRVYACVSMDVEVHVCTCVSEYVYVSLCSVEFVV